MSQLSTAHTQHRWHLGSPQLQGGSLGVRGPLPTGGQAQGTAGPRWGGTRGSVGTRRAHSSLPSCSGTSRRTQHPPCSSPRCPLCPQDLPKICSSTSPLLAIRFRSGFTSSRSILKCNDIEMHLPPLDTAVQTAP